MAARAANNSRLGPQAAAACARHERFAAAGCFGRGAGGAGAAQEPGQRAAGGRGGKGARLGSEGVPVHRQQVR